MATVQEIANRLALPSSLLTSTRNVQAAAFAAQKAWPAIKVPVHVQGVATLDASQFTYPLSLTDITNELGISSVTVDDVYYGKVKLRYWRAVNNAGTWTIIFERHVVREWHGRQFDIYYFRKPAIPTSETDALEIPDDVAYWGMMLWYAQLSLAEQNVDRRAAEGLTVLAREEFDRALKANMTLTGV